MMGAGSLQITTSVMQYGYRIIDDLIQGLKIFMVQRNYGKLSDFALAACFARLYAPRAASPEAPE